MASVFSELLKLDRTKVEVILMKIINYNLRDDSQGAKSILNCEKYIEIYKNILKHVKCELKL